VGRATLVDLHGTLSQIDGLKSFVGGVDRASPLLTSALFATYSPECVEGVFSQFGCPVRLLGLLH
jgi:hypothetical protein